MTIRRYRSRAIADRIIGFGISYQRDNLLARGLGLEHLRELLIRLARPLLRQGASIAYGGDWKEREDNFTYDLLRLISAEQEDNSLGGPDTNLTIGRLINHLAWPYYLDVTPAIEAQWINCCRIIRISQTQAGIAEADLATDAEARAAEKSDRVLFNGAVTLSAMRRLTTEEIRITIPDMPIVEIIPPGAARVILGGKIDNYCGFLPGIFEEALLTLENGRPLYVLGGFGGAAEALARAMLGIGNPRPEELTAVWHQEKTPCVAKLAALAGEFAMPPEVRPTSAALDALFALVEQARANLPDTLKTGLTDPETRELLMTRDVARAVQLVRKGLESQMGLEALPA